MSTQVSTPVSTPEIPTMSDALAAKISAAYTDTDSTIARRVVVIRAAFDAGFNVKRIAEILREKAATDPAIVPVAQSTLGYAGAAVWAVEQTRIVFRDAARDDLATLARAAKHVGVSPFKAGVRAALASLTDEVTGADRMAAIVEAARVALSTVRADRAAAKTREAHSQGGTRETLPAMVIDGETVGPAVVITDPARAALDGIRGAVKYLQHGGEWSNDLASAMAELADAMGAARRRTRQPVAA